MNEILKKGYCQAKILFKLFFRIHVVFKQLFGQSIDTSLLIKKEPLNQSNDVAGHSINAATSYVGVLDQVCQARAIP